MGLNKEGKKRGIPLGELITLRMDNNRATVEIIYGKRVTEYFVLRDYTVYCFEDDSAVCVIRESNNIVELRHMRTKSLRDAGFTWAIIAVKGSKESKMVCVDGDKGRLFNLIDIGTWY